MHTVIRNYKSAPGLADDLKKRIGEIESEISTVPGFIAYYLIKTTDGATSVTVCDERTGCDESTKRASSWLKKNMPHLKLDPPQIIGGEVSFKFANYKTTKV